MQLSLGREGQVIKQFTLRPIVLMVLLLSLVLASAVSGSIIISPVHRSQHTQYIAQLQYEQRNLIAKLSEAEAMLALRDAQIESMQAESLRNTHDIHAMNKRLAMFDDVLAARKVGGWHILHPTAQWLDGHNIAYSLVVVKGENYPRWAKGHISFSVIDSKGNVIALDNKAGKRSLQFDVTTHKFFEGTIPWPRDWKADVLMVSLFDKRGKNNQKIEIPIVNYYELKSDTFNRKALDRKALKFSAQILDAAAQQGGQKP